MFCRNKGGKRVISPEDSSAPPPDEGVPPFVSHIHITITRMERIQIYKFFYDPSEQMKKDLSLLKPFLDNVLLLRNLSNFKEGSLDKAITSNYLMLTLGEGTQIGLRW